MRPKLKKLKQILMENPYEGPAIRGQEENTENRVKKNIINTSVLNDIMPIEEGQKQSYLYFSKKT